MSLSLNAVPCRNGSGSSDDATRSRWSSHRRTTSNVGSACWMLASALSISSTDASAFVRGSIRDVLITIARAAASRRARSAAWFAAGTVRTRATRATIASGHQILALTSSSVNLSNTETRAPPRTRTPPTIPPRPADANCRRAGPKGLTCRRGRDDQEGLLDNEARVAVHIVGELGTRSLQRGQRGDQPPDLGGRLGVTVQVETEIRRRLDRGGDPIAQQGRRRQQDAVDLVTLGSPFASGEADLDPADRAAVRLFRPPLFVEERCELLVELGPKSFLVGGC